MLILAVMVLPTVALLSEAAITAVPRSVVNAAAALAMSRWSTIVRVVLPTARGGIGTACLLAAGRAVGESMAVLFVTGLILLVVVLALVVAAEWVSRGALRQGVTHT